MTRGILIVGGDSLIGGRLAERLKCDGMAVWKTTRRNDAPGLRLDLTDTADFSVPEGADTAVFLAAVTDIRRCEREPATRAINVDGVVSLAKRFLHGGMSVIFASSLVVFGEKREWPDEDDPHDAGIAYAKQKSMAEEAMRAAAEKLGAADRLAVARITRAVIPDGKPISDWTDAWKIGRSATPFKDFLFSPVTPEYVAEGLSAIIRGRESGNFHFSGEESMSYAEFCRRLADRLGLAENLVSPVSSAEAGVTPLFAPRCGGIGMRRTGKVLGISPQPADAAIGNIASGIRRRID